MKLALSLFFVGLAAAVVSGLGLAWDGAFQLAEILEVQSPGVAFGRFTQMPLFWAVLWVSRLTSDANFLIWLFGGLHAAFPFLSLLGAWVIVRKRKPALFVWVALAIGLLTLPGQACLVCQSQIAVQVAWVVLAAVLAGMTRKATLLVLIAVPVILFLHPVAILLFAVAAGFAFVRGVQDPTNRKDRWKWTLVFLAILAAAALRTFLFRGAYETAQLGFGEWQRAFDAGVAGYPLQMLVFAWSAAALIFIEPFSGKLKLAARIAALVSVFAAFLLMALWASDAHAWENALDYRDWAFFLIVPVFGLALFDRAGNLSSFRKLVIQSIALGFAVTMVIQSIVWVDLSDRLRAEIETHAGCFEARNIKGIPNTAMGGWSVTAYSLLIQGKQPQSVAYYWESCANLNFTWGYWVANFAPWDYIRWDSGWFDKRALQNRVSPTACNFFPEGNFPEASAGWYPLEFGDYGWQRWMMQTATISVSGAQSGKAQFEAIVSTTRGGKEVTVNVNGEKAIAFRIKDDSPKVLALPLELRSGANEIVLSVDFEPLQANEYPPALLVRNARITRAAQRPLCP